MLQNELQGKVAVITGATGGIGKIISERLARDGCDCLLVARHEDVLSKLASELSLNSGRKVEYAAADLRTIKGCKKTSDLALRYFTGVDILINCAGATKGGTFLDLGNNDWIDGFNLKFHGAVRLSRLLWPTLKTRKGTIINIGGSAAYSPNANFMIGGAVNVALAHFSKSLAELGLKDDVNVNIIHPGVTVTDRMTTLHDAQAKAENKSVSEVQQNNIETAGVRRLGQPEDIAELVAFLCSPKARHIQGVGISVDGGSTKGFH